MYNALSFRFLPLGQAACKLPPAGHSAGHSGPDRGRPGRRERLASARRARHQGSCGSWKSCGWRRTTGDRAMPCAPCVLAQLASGGTRCLRRECERVCAIAACARPGVSTAQPVFGSDAPRTKMGRVGRVRSERSARVFGPTGWWTGARVACLCVAAAHVYI